MATVHTTLPPFTYPYIQACRDRCSARSCPDRWLHSCRATTRIHSPRSRSVYPGIPARRSRWGRPFCCGIWHGCGRGWGSNGPTSSRRTSQCNPLDRCMRTPGSCLALPDIGEYSHMAPERRAGHWYDSPAPTSRAHIGKLVPLGGCQWADTSHCPGRWTVGRVHWKNHNACWAGLAQATDTGIGSQMGLPCTLPCFGKACSGRALRSWEVLNLQGFTKKKKYTYTCAEIFPCFPNLPGTKCNNG